METVKSTQNVVLVDAPPEVVWASLTKPDLMKEWMGETEMNIHVSTNWEVGSPIQINGYHHIKFENKGVVLDFKPLEKLEYSHLSSLSKLPDVKENYSIITFLLKRIDKQTEITLSLENFPTATIYKHLDFYWRGTLMQMKDFIEQRMST